MSFILSLIGLVLIIEGLPYFAIPLKVKKWSLSIQKMPESSLRTFGFIAMMTGLLLVYIGRRYL